MGLTRIMSSTSHKSVRYYIATALLLILPAPTAQVVQAKPSIASLTPRNIDITALPLPFQIDAPDKKSFGLLRWRGGFSLSSTSPYFGGFSGLAIDAKGEHLLAVSDAGIWMLAELGYKESNFVSVKHVKIGPLTSMDGKPLALSSHRDAESIALQAGKFFGNTAFVSFERKHRIVPYEIKKSGLKRKPGYTKLPNKLTAGLKNLGDNQGLEAIEFIRSGKRKGSLIVFPERLKNKSGNLKGWIIRDGKSKPLKVERLKGFDITGIAALPDGGMILLERRFRVSEGVQMRLRRINANSIKPDHLLKGETLIEVHGSTYNIDNMEGIAVHSSKSGETIITLIADDNYNMFQRTLIMQFALSHPPKKQTNAYFRNKRD